MGDKSELWYRQPARRWEEALPIGNGRNGAMIMGGVNRDVIYLNNDSIWSGRPENRINKDALKYLPKIRKLIREGNIREAEQLSLMALSGTPNSEKSYEPAGELVLDFDGTGSCEDYCRRLELESGLAEVSYRSGETEYMRQYIASYPDRVIVCHLRAEHGTLGFRCHLDRCHNRADRVWADGDEIGMEVSSCVGIPFAVRVKARVTGGSTETIGEHLIIRDAVEADLLIDIQTGFYEEDYLQAGAEHLQAVAAKPWEELQKDHRSDFEKGFATVSLQLGGPDSADKNSLPTDVRLQKLETEEDPDLYALYFQYGRYLLFSSSRGDCLPANLQGIWNRDLTPPWDSKYTININAEMNYWIAESGNLSDCHMPYFRFLSRVCENGKRTARGMYGCRGSVAHHNSDIYADTAPQDHYIPASFWVMGEAWMATHIWKHYLYTGDKAFLEEYFDVLEECLTFFEDFLIEGPGGELVTSPSVSPENTYIMPNGTRGCMCEGPTMDIEILTEILEDYKNACRVLGKDPQTAGRARKLLDRLPKIRIGKHGQIQEWMEDYEEAEPGHRHISHLYGVYPGTSISYEKTPELMQAAEVTLRRRLANGGGHTGWSRAWIIGLWAHFRNGEMVHENLKALLCQSTLPNLMDSHPYGAGAVFQIDGNLGASAAIIEMLVQCMDDGIRLLPALPQEFSEGSVKGIRLSGGLTLEMCWKESRVTEWKVRKDGTDSAEPQEIQVIVNDETCTVRI